MKRFSLNSKRRKLIAAGGLLAASIVLASAFLVGSGADFTATSANPSNVFTSGTLTMSNVANSGTTAGVIVTNTNMKPGDAPSGTVVIKNTGSLAGDFTLSIAHDGTKDVIPVAGYNLYDKLQLKIVKDGDTADPIYNGALDAFSPISFPAWAADASHTFTITVTLPSNAGNEYQATSSTIEFDWDATQTN